MVNNRIAASSWKTLKNVLQLPLVVIVNDYLLIKLFSNQWANSNTNFHSWNRHAQVSHEQQCIFDLQ